MEMICSIHKRETNENCKSCNFLKNLNNSKYYYEASYSQYTQNNYNKPLRYSSRIYLEKVIDKYYKNNKEIKNNYDKILNLNDEFEEAYLDVKCSKRKNSLNVHFKLFKLLQLCGVKCNISDFQKVSNKREITLNKYNKMWEEICEINKWKLIE